MRRKRGGSVDFKLGRRPPKDAPAIRLASFLTGIVPAHPAGADYLGRLSSWQMLGNDQHGDCVAVTWANTRRLVTATLAKENYPTLAQVYALYKTQNPDFPAQDQGMSVQTCLEYLIHTGGPDGVKAVGFAAVDYLNVEEVKAAIAIFGSVWTGINVQAANQKQFAQHEPWGYNPNASTIGGHSVIVGGYGVGTGILGGDERFITWAQETSFTDGFWSHLVEEAWVVIWPEMLTNPAFLAGVNLEQFAADYTAITGRPFPTPQPPPKSDPFTDIASLDLEGYAGACYAAGKGWLLGYADHTFRPYEPLLKRHVALIADRAGLPVPDAWLLDYTPALRGDVKTAFPAFVWTQADWSVALTRVQLCRLLWRNRTT